MSDEIDLVATAMVIGNIEDPERRKAALEAWDEMFAGQCDVTFCVGEKGHGGDTHYDGTGTSFTVSLNDDGEEVRTIVHTNFDPITD